MTEQLENWSDMTAEEIERVEEDPCFCEEAWKDDQITKIEEYCKTVVGKPYMTALSEICTRMKSFKVEYEKVDEESDGYKFVTSIEAIKFTKDEGLHGSRIWEFCDMKGMRCIGDNAADVIQKLQNVFALEMKDALYVEALTEMGNLVDEEMSL